MSPGWWQMTLVCRPDVADTIAAEVVTVTGFAVEEPQPGTIRAVAGSDVDAERLVADLVRRHPGLEASVTPFEPVDWNVRWRDGISTHRLGRLVITPSWLPVSDAGEAAVVVIDPESAFGSGEHGSTRAALRLLERHLRPGQRVLDFGSGSGILAIAAVKLGALSAVGVEVDESVNPIAEANAVKNRVADRTFFLTGDAAVIGALAGPADIVCSNILRSVNTGLLAAIEAALCPGGLAIYSGMELAEREQFLEVLVVEGWQPVDEVTDDGWWALAATRPL